MSKVFQLILLLSCTMPLTLNAEYSDISTIESESKTTELSHEEQDYLAEIKSVKMCVDPDWMPMERIKNGKHEGIAADFIELIRDYLETPIELVITQNWSQSIEFAKTRKCDIFSMAMATPERLDYMLFTKPYLTLPMVLATRKEHSYVTDVTLMNNEKLGIVSGYAFSEIFKIQYPDLEIEEIPSLRDGLLKVENGELDGMIGTLASVGYLIQRGYPELKIAGKFQESWQLGVGVRNDRLLLFSAFEKAVQQIDKKTAQNILNRWISVKYEQPFNYDLLWKVLVSFAIIFGFFAFRQHILKKYNKELREHKKNLELEVVNRTKDLLIAKEKAELASQEKSRFLANMSHELRTPMHAIHSFTKLTLKRDLDPKARHFLENIEISTARLTHLLNDLLDLSKLEAGKMELNLHSSDIAKIITKTLHAVDSLIKDKKLEVDISEISAFTVELDENLIMQVITNLLSNAIKFSPEKGRVMLTSTMKNNKVLFSIEDEGIGIPADEQETIFDPFVQSSKTMSKSGGTGLGLPICKEIIDLHGGEIWAESPPAGKTQGARISFSIPLIQDKIE